MLIRCLLKLILGLAEVHGLTLSILLNETGLLLASTLPKLLEKSCLFLTSLLGGFESMISSSACRSGRLTQHILDSLLINLFEGDVE